MHYFNWKFCCCSVRILTVLALYFHLVSLGYVGPEHGAPASERTPRHDKTFKHKCSSQVQTRVWCLCPRLQSLALWVFGCLYILTIINKNLLPVRTSMCRHLFGLQFSVIQSQGIEYLFLLKENAENCKIYSLNVRYNSLGPSWCDAFPFDE